MSHILPPTVLASFWKGPFWLIAITMIRLITLKGRFPLKTREICWVTTTKDFGDTFFRSFVPRTLEDLYQEILLVKIPCSLQLGAAFPSHHITKQVPVTPYPPLRNRQGEVTITFEGPREWERGSFKRNSLYSVHEARTENAPLATPMGELVIDIDLDCEPRKEGEPHYCRDGICGCGKEKKICDVCSEIFLDTAQRVLNYLLRDVFEFKAMFWVFSGRRGLHCWVLDEKVQCMTNAQRRVFIDRIMLMGKGRVHDDVADHIYQEFLKPIVDKYPIFKQRQQQNKRDVRESAFWELFPKLDEAVSIDASHLRKLPLTLHPSSGNLCVVVGDVDGPYKFVPSQDTIHVSKIRDVHMLAGERRIKEALSKF